MKQVVWMLPVALVISGCLGLNDLKNTTEATKNEVSKTNEEVKKTNEQMGRLQGEVAETNVNLLNLTHKQSTIGLLATMNTEGMSNIGVAAAQKFLTIVTEEELRKYIATPYPVRVPWIKEGLPNVSFVGKAEEDIDISVERPLDQDPMTDQFYRLFKRASYVTLKELLAKSKDPNLSETDFATLQETAERAVLVAPKLWGARNLQTKAPLESAAEQQIIAKLVREVVSFYQLPEEVAQLAEVAIDAL